MRLFSLVFLFCVACILAYVFVCKLACYVVCRCVSERSRHQQYVLLWYVQLTSTTVLKMSFHLCSLLNTVTYVHILVLLGHIVKLVSVMPMVDVLIH